jgi:hypothetical protein
VATNNQIYKRTEVASIFLACTSAASTLLKYVSLEKPAIELQFERSHGEGGATSDLVEPRPSEGADFVLRRSRQRRRKFRLRPAFVILLQGHRFGFESFSLSWHNSVSTKSEIQHVSSTRATPWRHPGVARITSPFNLFLCSSLSLIFSRR